MVSWGVWAAVLLTGAGGLRWEAQPSGTEVRLRGVSAVSARVAWASGDKGTVLRTTDGGRHWQPVPVPDAAGLDLRDVDAFSADAAYALAIGPGDRSRIYKTLDGGRHWTVQFTNADPKAFYDALAFWDARRGLALSDPVDGAFRLLATSDGGATWAPVASAGLPAALPGEAGFAASGTSLTVQGARNAWFGMGGAAARVLRSEDGGRSWRASPTPLATGEGAGVFSLLFWSARDGVAVGGNYQRPDDPSGNVALTRDGGRTWREPSGARPRGYRSCVARTRGLLVAVGPSGTDVSRDGGETWAPLGTDGFHAASAARDGTVWAVGEHGRIARLVGPGAR